MNKIINKSQLIKDGFVQLKTKRQLIAQGLLIKDTHMYSPSGYKFINVQKPTPLAPEMLQDLGKIRKIASTKRSKFQIDLENVHSPGEYLRMNQIGYIWPIEAIAK